jgi:hypothetical protein
MMMMPKPRRLLRQRLDQRIVRHAQVQTGALTALQRQHDTLLIEPRIAAVWPHEEPRWVSVNGAPAVHVDSRHVLVPLAVTLAQHMPSHLTVVIDDVDVVVVPGGDFYYARRFACLLADVRQAISNQDSGALGALCALIETMLVLPCLARRHRIDLSDGKTKVECRARVILLRFVLTVARAVCAYLTAPTARKVPAGGTPDRISTDEPKPRDAPRVSPCPASTAVGLWPRAFAEEALGREGAAVTVGAVTYQRCGDIWLRCSHDSVALQCQTAVSRFVQDYGVWGGCVAVDGRNMPDPVVEWAETLHLCVRMDGLCLWSVERALVDALARCSRTYLMHGTFSAMLDCIRSVESSPRIHRAIIAPAVLANMGVDDRNPDHV